MIGLNKDKSGDSIGAVTTPSMDITEQKIERIRKRTTDLNGGSNSDNNQKEEKPFQFFNNDIAPVRNQASSRFFANTTADLADEEDFIEEPTEENSEVFAETEEPNISDLDSTSAVSDELQLAFEESFSMQKGAITEPESKQVFVAEKIKPSKESLLDRFKGVVAKYNTENSGVVSSEASIMYYDDTVSDVKMSNGEMLMPIRKVYLNGVEVPFDSLGEVRIPHGGEIEVDLGVSIAMPNGVNLQIDGVSELTKKFGLNLRNPLMLRRQETVHPIVVQLVAVDELAYISKYQSVVQAKFVTV